MRNGTKFFINYNNNRCEARVVESYEHKGRIRYLLAIDTGKGFMLKYKEYWEDKLNNLIIK